MKKYFKLAVIIALLGVFISAESCRARDCKGRRKTAKTNMGGWL